MLLVSHRNGAVGQRLACELAAVETRFSAELLSDLGCVNALVSHVERFRGKMLRPSLVLLAAAAVRPEQSEAGESHLILATVAEMVHMATLVHDDILDEAQVRRRGSTINRLAGNEAAVMLGDYLISHAYHLCSALDDQSVARAIAATTNTVCEGELLQLANRCNWDLNERTYFEIVRRKTASLCGTCCRLSGSLAGADDSTCEALSAYGEKLGIAFQITDDVLDLVGDARTVGKTLGRDLDKGKLTLPMIRYLATAADPAERDLLLADGVPEDPQAADVTLAESLRDERIALWRQRLGESDALDYARAWAQRLVDDAKAVLRQALPDSPVRGLMLEMADAVVHRGF